jgi:cystathionine beta-lyase/cystathionine gamma-synthase
VYGDTRDLLARDLPAWGLDVVQVDAMDIGAWRTAVGQGRTRVVYVETLANPQLDLADLPALAHLAHEAGAVLVVDNTFATPYNVQPLSLGADVVVHSATKYLNGHSDAIAGVVLGPVAVVREVQRRVITLGTCLDPHAAYLVWRGLQTFDLRLARCNATARELAAVLAARDDVAGVRHPSLPGYERADVAERVLRRDQDVLRTGGMVTFVVSGGDERALAVMRHLEVASEATSLGGVETLVSTPFNSSHFSLTPEERSASRIDDGMIRVSCGVEPTHLLIEDFTRALDAVPLVSA